MVATRRLRPIAPVVSATAAMSVGVAIYLAYAPKSLLVFDWMSSIGADHWASTLRSSASPTPSWVRHNLPDGLWMYAAILLMSLPWRGKPLKGEVACWLFLPFLLAVAAEIAQGLGRISGTFDPLDIASFTTGALAAVVQIRRDSHAQS